MYRKGTVKFAVVFIAFSVAAVSFCTARYVVVVNKKGGLSATLKFSFEMKLLFYAHQLACYLFAVHTQHVD